MMYLSPRPSQRVLVIGRSPAINQSVVGPLLALGIPVQGSTDPEGAARQFDAADFDLVVFGRGIVGPLSERLARDFTLQNRDIRWIAAVAPVAVRQILSALDHDPRLPRHAMNFRVMEDGPDLLVQATVLSPCAATIEIYRHPDADAPPVELVDRSAAEPGPFERRVEGRHLQHAQTLLMTMGGDEYFLHPLGSPALGIGSEERLQFSQKQSE
ncbi:hypothetical protein ACFW16_23625 [Inquilinus sp. NPDC058860]|uniref:hypothetical protein n=1 Tax=Inquilinus sp. NPDC058860 TaxID=3346652 RepID=UPI0036C2E5DA